MSFEFHLCLIEKGQTINKRAEDNPGYQGISLPECLTKQEFRDLFGKNGYIECYRQQKQYICTYIILQLFFAFPCVPRQQLVEAWCDCVEKHSYHEVYTHLTNLVNLVIDPNMVKILE